MVRKKQELRFTVVENAKGGKGEFINHHILEKDEFFGKGRHYAKCKLAPGHSVGCHTHVDEFEVCHFISGQGTVIENGIATIVNPGDTNIVLSGQNHEVINTGTEDLIYTALIIYDK